MTRLRQLRRPCQGQQGFTLLELLVVVSIIAVLLAILLPVMNRTRRKAQGISCAANLRQLHMASLMFAQDHGGHLPRPHQANELSNNVAATQVCVWLHLRTDAAGHADFADGSGVLWPYLEGGPVRRQAVLTCPGDGGEQSAGWRTNDQYPRNYSYSMNSLVASPKDVARSGAGGEFLPGIAFSSVLRPAEKIMWYEEEAPNDTWNMMQLNQFDVPTARHGTGAVGNVLRSPPNRNYTYAGLGNFCFFDGHVESLTPQYALDPRNSRLHRPLQSESAQ